MNKKIIKVCNGCGSLYLEKDYCSKYQIDNEILKNGIVISPFNCQYAKDSEIELKE